MPKMEVPQPVHDWLTALRAQLSAARGRNVTYPEVWEHLREQSEATDKLGRDVRGRS